MFGRFICAEMSTGKDLKLTWPAQYAAIVLLTFSKFIYDLSNIDIAASCKHTTHTYQFYLSGVCVAVYICDCAKIFISAPG